MTAPTLTETTASPATAPRSSGGGTDRGVLEPAFLAMVGLTCVTALGMGRLFAGGEYLLPVLAAALVAHALSWVARALRLPGTVGVLVAMAGVALAAVWLVLPATTTFGIPWAGSLEAAVGALQAAGREFATAVAPAPATPGFLLGSMIGVGLAAALADWAAFRVGSTFESLIPTFGLFLFTAILGADQRRWLAVAAQLAAMLAFAALHGARTRAAAMPWFASRAHGSSSALVQGAAVLGAVAVASALLLGPRLPGAHAQGIFDWRMRDEPGGGRRTTISPLVDIRNRLTDRSTTEAFTVRSTARSYWRLTALDTFDGAIWSSNDSYKRAGGRLPLPGPRAPAREIVQQFAISDLASIWLPAAFRPLRVENVDGVSYNADSASLISREETSDGLTYEVVSEQPALTAEGLSESPPLEGRSLQRHLALPEGISGRVYRLAQTVTAGQSTPYGQARALQDHLRTFTYDIDVDQGHDGRALERFLFENRRGYCEQFAGSYAVLARMVGLPSRVAVGFTPGEQAPDGTFHVLGLHAHAWPEVYLDGYGWVAFEPTPGRGAPGAEPYTGVPESQASAAQPSVATTAAPTTTAIDGAGGGETTTTTAPADAGAPEPPETRRSLFERTLPWVVAIALLGAATWLVGVPTVRRARRRRRRATAAGAAERILVAWAEADEALGLAGARRRQSETLTEHARRVAAALPEAARPALAGLARDATAASYAEEVEPELAGHAISAAATVETAVAESTSRARRLRRELSLRP